MKIKIAGINIDVRGELYDYFKYRVRDYISSDSECDIIITYRENSNIVIPQGEIVKKNGFRVFGKNNEGYFNYDILSDGKASALITSDEKWQNIHCELYDVEDLGGASLSIRLFNMIGEVVKHIMVSHNGMCLHSSSICYNNSGVMFSANSGTGKSTHTRLWKKVLKGTEIINDDMPAIRCIEDKWYLFGVPWSGKTEINANKQVPLKALVFLERGEKNEIEPMYAPEYVFKIMEQTTVPKYKAMTVQVMNNISGLVKSVPVYRLRCNISDEAPLTVAKELGLI